MNALTNSTYINDVNEFICDLKHVKDEINSKFIEKPRFHIRQDGNTILKNLSKKINWHPYNGAPIKINLREIDYCLDLAINFAENPNVFFSAENNRSPQYFKLWENLKKELSKVNDISTSIQFLNKQDEKKVTIVVCCVKNEFVLSPEILKSLEKSLVVFNKRSEALLDFYEPLFPDKEIRLFKSETPALKRAEKIRELLISKRKAIICYNKAPLVFIKMHSTQETQRKNRPNPEQLHDKLFNS